MKPNVSVLASEAFVMFAANKTSLWLEGKNENEQMKLINEATHNVKKVRDTFKRRTELIEANQRQRLEESLQRTEAAEAKRLERLKGYSKKIIYYGLWQSETEVESALNEINTKTDTIEALKVQLNFRHHVLKQNPEDSNRGKWCKAEIDSRRNQN